MNFRKKLFLWTVIVAIICVLIWLLSSLRSPQPTTTFGSSMKSPIYPDRRHNNPNKGTTNIIDIVPEGKVFSKGPDMLQGNKPPSSNRPAIIHPFNIEPISSQPIESLLIEERYTFNIKEGYELPPDEAPFVAGDVNAFLQSRDGKIPLEFVSPVEFIKQGYGRIVVVNHFSLQNDSDLYSQPVDRLRNLDAISAPVIVALYGSSLETMVALEVSFVVNGLIIWSYQLQTNYPFNPGIPMRLNTNFGNKFREPLEER